MSKETCKDGLDWAVIDAYSRKEALEDGVLWDVSTMASEAGFRFPVALTHAVREQCVTVPQGAIGQDESSRLWDILFLLAYTVRTQSGGGIRYFSVFVQNGSRRPRAVKLKAVFHHGDEGEPVVTVMLPTED